MTEFFAEIAVRHRNKVWERTREEAHRNLQLLDRLLMEYHEVVKWVRPRAGMVGFPWLVSGAETRRFCQAAIAHGLLLAPGDCFGVPDHFRVGFGVGREWFPRAMERLGELLHSWKQKAI